VVDPNKKPGCVPGFFRCDIRSRVAIVDLVPVVLVIADLVLDILVLDISVPRCFVAEQRNR